jgi:hypothetical protein
MANVHGLRHVGPSIVNHDPLPAEIQPGAKPRVACHRFKARIDRSVTDREVQVPGARDLNPRDHVAARQASTDSLRHSARRLSCSFPRSHCPVALKRRQIRPVRALHNPKRWTKPLVSEGLADNRTQVCRKISHGR